MDILLAVSGGVDSMYLASRAAEFYPEARLAIAHCNFSLRGEESDADERFVSEWADAHAVTLYRRRFATHEWAEARGISVEMAARELRYGWFGEICASEGFDAVAVAHNADDNAETLLLNIVRGCGMRGLRGMSPNSLMPLADGSRLRVLRPMLGISREEIVAWMLGHGCAWREDSSNASDRYKRNILRHKVLPVLRELNPSLLRTLSANMNRWTAAGGIVDSAFEAFSSRVRTGDEVCVDKLLAEKDWEYMLWRMTEGLMDAGQYEDLVRLLKSGGTFAGRRFGSVTTASGRIVLPGAGSGAANDQGLRIEGPGTYSVGGQCVCIRRAVRVPGESLKAPLGTLFARLDFPFVLRFWEEGDWIRPFGMGGRRRKLSDIFSDMKLSIADKRRTLVIEDPEDKKHTLAIVGKRIDESLAVGDADTDYLILTS